MGKRIVKPLVVMLFISLLPSYLSASLTHGSMKGSGLPLYAQYNNGTMDPGTVRSGVTFDFKVVTIGSKSWAWTGLSGGTLGGAAYGSQLRYWSMPGNSKTENWLENRVAGDANQAYGSTTNTIPSTLQLSFYQAVNGDSESARISYDITAKNSSVVGDVTPPTIESSTIGTRTETSVTLNIIGSDDQSDVFYYISGNGVEEVSFTSLTNITGLVSGNTYNLTITPIDFSGNEGIPKEVNFTTGLSYGSIRGSAIKLYEQGTAGGNTLGALRTTTLDYKAVTIGAKTWSWLKTTGSYIGTGADYMAQLRYWTSTNAKTENNMINRNATADTATETWTNAVTTSMPSPLNISFFVSLVSGGYSETTLIPYQPTLTNSPVSGDDVPPVITACTSGTVTITTVVLNFEGSDDRSDLFYHITGNGYNEVAFRSGYLLTGLTANTIYTFKVTPIDFSGNEGASMNVTFKTPISRSQIIDNKNMNYNTTVLPTGTGGELVSIINQSGGANTLTIGCTTASTLLGGNKDRTFKTPKVIIDGTEYPLTIDASNTTATVTFTGNIGGKTIQPKTIFQLKWSVIWISNNGNFFTGTFSYIVGDNGQTDVIGSSTPVLTKTGNTITWPPCIDNLSGVKSYEIYEVGQPTLTIIDLNQSSFSYTLIDPENTVAVRAVDFVDNKSAAASVNDADNYRSKTTGSWDNNSIWEYSLNNADWSNATSVPTTTSGSICILKDQLVTLSSDKNAPKIYLYPRGKLTLSSGIALTSPALNLYSDGTGTATFVDNGTVNFTAVKVQQYLPKGRNWYVSSPITNATRSTISSAPTVLSYNESTATWVTESSSLIPMKGYAATITLTGNVIFTGPLNTGNESITLYRTETVGKSGYNLVGNPYPSYVNWELATKTDLLSTMWYRTKNSTNAAYVFDTYNADAHVGTSLNGTAVTAEIPPMQAFWVRVADEKSSGILAFNNAMRLHETATNRLKAPAAKHDLQQVLRLRVSNSLNSDEAIVLFNANASDGYDTYD